MYDLPLYVILQELLKAHPSIFDVLTKYCNYDFDSPYHIFHAYGDVELSDMGQKIVDIDCINQYNVVIIMRQAADLYIAYLTEQGFDTRVPRELYSCGFSSHIETYRMEVRHFDT